MKSLLDWLEKEQDNTIINQHSINMNQLSRIGLNAEKSQELATLLNDLLTNYSVFYQNVRGTIGTSRGTNFSNCT